MQPRSDAELRALSDEHLLYELQMLAYAVQQLRPGWRHVPATATQADAVLLESWAVHARNLADFLYPPKRRRRDWALAEHFFEPGEWDRIRPAKPATFKTIKRRANQELAHLSYARLAVKPGHKPWNVTALTNDLLCPLRMFLERAPRDRVSEQFLREAASLSSPLPEGESSVGVATGLSGP